MEHGGKIGPESFEGLTFGSRDSAFAGDSVLTAAMLDRILQQSIIVGIKRESFGLIDKCKPGCSLLQPGPSSTRGG